MSEPWLVWTVLVPSAARRRILSGAAVSCAAIAAALAGAALSASSPAPLPAIALALAAAFALARAARRGEHGVGAPDSLMIDATGRVLMGGLADVRDAPPSAPGAAPARRTATPRFVSPLLVVLGTDEGIDGVRIRAVWCDSLPRSGFRRLVVAARWTGAAPSA